ncbi:uncharacterized protein LTR77_003161 [Saxophila tyrrhenica]|uniref:Uncharacterized protein n=1 Tax=Saxophila tyrrhenica TaxID=1690608 RepID=A0AAV9PGL6_9PEZI|nr:hypothetical protein LTR77_003161 [Saxophila tyrrhenica]
MEISAVCVLQMTPNVSRSKRRTSAPSSKSSKQSQCHNARVRGQWTAELKLVLNTEATNNLQQIHQSSMEGADRRGKRPPESPTSLRSEPAKGPPQGPKLEGRPASISGDDIASESWRRRVATRLALQSTRGTRSGEELQRPEQTGQQSPNESSHQLARGHQSPAPSESISQVPGNTGNQLPESAIMDLCFIVPFAANIPQAVMIAVHNDTGQQIESENTDSVWPLTHLDTLAMLLDDYGPNVRRFIVYFHLHEDMSSTAQSADIERCLQSLLDLSEGCELAIRVELSSEAGGEGGVDFAACDHLLLVFTRMALNHGLMATVNRDHTDSWGEEALDILTFSAPSKEAYQLQHDDKTSHDSLDEDNAEAMERASI